MANIQRSQDGALWNHRKPLAQTKMLRDSHAKGRVRPELLVPLHSRFWCWWCWCVPRNSQKTWQRHATTWFKPVNLARIGSRCLNSKQTATSDQRLVYVRKISQQALGVKHGVAAKVQVYHMLHTNIPLFGWGWGVFCLRLQATAAKPLSLWAQLFLESPT